MPYPDKLLAEDEEVVSHLHPHWTTVFWPVVRFLLVVGAASFGCAVVPAGPDQGVWRLVVVAAGLVLLLVLVAGPLLRWRTTHYVITTHRLLWRSGVLSRTGRDIGLSRITDVSYRQTLWQRLIRSGTVTLETAGEGGPTVLTAVPDSEAVQQLVNQLVEEDADRRARESAGYVGEHASGWHGGRSADGPDGGWGDEGRGDAGWGSGDDGWGAGDGGEPGDAGWDRYGRGSTRRH